jgi:hypothetical protein
MRSALLRGREHHTYGWTDLIADGPVATAISIGGAPKTYGHTDPNEDAAGAGWGPSGAVLAVADAHDGFEAAEVLVEHLLTAPAPQWADDADLLDGDHWQRYALAALCDGNAEVLRERSSRAGFASSATLTLAVVQPASNRLLFAAMGDSLLFAVGADGAREIGPVETHAHKSTFLGQQTFSVEVLTRIARIGEVPLDDAFCVVAVTDGLSEHGIGVKDPADAVAEAALAARRAEIALRPSSFARGVSEVALAAQRDQQAGDNVAVAVWWRPDLSR